MLQPNDPQTAFEKGSQPPFPIQLLLFVDDRPSSQETIRAIQSYLESMKSSSPSELQIIEIREQPDLVEYFRLVVTPALVKIAPGPRQTLAGSNIIEQLQHFWPCWKHPLEGEEAEQVNSVETGQPNNMNYPAELLHLSDEVFRLKKEKEELQKQLKFKDQVLAMLAHDLRSPLTAASIALETIELTQNQPETHRSVQLREHLYQQARKQFRLMNRLITDILQASKSMNAQFSLQSSQWYLQSLCQEILEQYRTSIQDKFQTLEIDLPQDLPPVYADEELIRQVIVNLLENAIKYTPEGGKIDVSILHRTIQKVQISICDTGPGIPEEKKERIFEGHFRLKRDEAKEGYGLGLSLCRKIISAHYGQIWVDSILEQGSCFHFTLPIYR